MVKISMNLLSEIPIWVVKTSMNLLSKIPIWGCVFKYDPKARKEAFYEMSVIVLFSTMPIWLGNIINSFLLYSEQENSSYPFLFFSNFNEYIQNGELLVYILALTGPTFYLLLTNSNGNESQNFPYFRLFAFVSFILGIVSAVMYFHANDNEYTNNTLFLTSTKVMYLFALFLLYPFFTFKHQANVSIPRASTSLTKNFQSGYAEHLKDKGN